MANSTTSAISEQAELKASNRSDVNNSDSISPEPHNDMHDSKNTSQNHNMIPSRAGVLNLSKDRPGYKSRSQLERPKYGHNQLQTTREGIYNCNFESGIKNVVSHNSPQFHLRVPSTAKRMPNSITSSKLSSNKSVSYINRSAKFPNSKPTHQRPPVEIGDKDSDIYEGEQISYHESDFHDDMTEEFVEVEEIEQEIPASMRTSLAIREAKAEEESSGENTTSNHKNLNNYKQQQIHNPRNQGLDLMDYLPKQNLTSRKVPDTSENKSTKKHQYRPNIKVNNNFDLSNPNFTQNFEEDKYDFSTIDKPTTVSPETYHVSHNNYNRYIDDAEDHNSSIKLDNLQGDTDALSQKLKQRRNVSPSLAYFTLI
jgi:hypothetical protein